MGEQKWEEREEGWGRESGGGKGKVGEEEGG